MYIKDSVTHYILGHYTNLFGYTHTFLMSGWSLVGVVHEVVVNDISVVREIENE